MWPKIYYHVTLFPGEINKVNPQMAASKRIGMPHVDHHIGGPQITQLDGAPLVALQQTMY